MTNLWGGEGGFKSDGNFYHSSCIVNIISHQKRRISRSMAVGCVPLAHHHPWHARSVLRCGEWPSPHHCDTVLMMRSVTKTVKGMSVITVTERQAVGEFFFFELTRSAALFVVSWHMDRCSGTDVEDVHMGFCDDVAGLQWASKCIFQCGGSCRDLLCSQVSNDADTR